MLYSLIKRICNEEADITTKEATSPSSDVIRRRIPYQDLVVTLHNAEFVEQNMEHLQKNKNS